MSEIPRVIVIAEGSGEEAHMTLSERVTAADFESRHLTSQLIERVRWAVGDAHHAEQLSIQADERVLTSLPPSQTLGSPVR